MRARQAGKSRSGDEASRGIEGAEPHRASVAVAQSPQLGARGANRFLRRIGCSERHEPRLGRSHRTTLEQLEADSSLELGDVLRDRCRRVSKLIGRRGEGARADGGLQRCQPSRIQHKVSLT